MDSGERPHQEPYRPIKPWVMPRPAPIATRRELVVNVIAIVIVGGGVDVIAGAASIMGSEGGVGWLFLLPFVGLLVGAALGLVWGLSLLRQGRLPGQALGGDIGVCLATMLAPWVIMALIGV